MPSTTSPNDSRHHVLFIVDSIKLVVPHLVPRLHALIHHGFSVHLVTPHRRDLESSLQLLPPDLYLRPLPSFLPAQLILTASYLIEHPPTLLHAIGDRSSLAALTITSKANLPALLLSLPSSPNKHPLRGHLLRRFVQTSPGAHFTEAMLSRASAILTHSDDFAASLRRLAPTTLVRSLPQAGIDSSQDLEILKLYDTLLRQSSHQANLRPSPLAHSETKTPTHTNT